MKSYRRQIAKTGWMLALIYIICILLGFLGSFSITVYRARSGALAIARIQAGSYADGRGFRVLSQGEAVLIFDKSGRALLELTAENGDLNVLSREFLLRRLPRILASRELFMPVYSRSSRSVMLLAGTPLTRGGAIIGAVFNIRPVRNAANGFWRFFGVFTLVYSIGAVCVLYIIKRTNELEVMRKTYIANISRDLEAPIASIKTLMESIGGGVVRDEESRRRYYGIILTETNRLDRAIRDLLELSKIQSGQVDFSRASAPASLIFDPICEKYRMLCEDRYIRFHVSESVAALPALYTNAGGIARLLDILLDNALRYAKEEGGVWLEACVQGRRAVIRVGNDGASVMNGAPPKASERFSGEYPPYSSVRDGLSFTIAREIALALGEEISAKSEPGEGMVFRVTIQIK